MSIFNKFMGQMNLGSNAAPEDAQQQQVVNNYYYYTSAQEQQQSTNTSEQSPTPAQEAGTTTPTTPANTSPPPEDEKPPTSTNSPYLGEWSGIPFHLTSLFGDYKYKFNNFSAFESSIISKALKQGQYTLQSVGGFNNVQFAVVGNQYAVMLGNLFNLGVQTS